ncbi:MAG TPA: hypothetical protein VFV37_07060 [Luteibaculaceae bacterium]|nr:hypothetical protein [Luteibaculaceae bacterium]
MTLLLYITFASILVIGSLVLNHLPRKQALVGKIATGRATITLQSRLAFEASMKIAAVVVLLLLAYASGWLIDKTFAQQSIKPQSSVSHQP